MKASVLSFLAGMVIAEALSFESQAIPHKQQVNIQAKAASAAAVGAVVVGAATGVGAFSSFGSSGKHKCEEVAPVCEGCHYEKDHESKGETAIAKAQGECELLTGCEWVKPADGVEGGSYTCRSRKQCKEVKPLCVEECLDNEEDLATAMATAKDECESLTDCEWRDPVAFQGGRIHCVQK